MDEKVFGYRVDITCDTHQTSLSPDPIGDATGAIGKSGSVGERGERERPTRLVTSGLGLVSRRG